MVELFSKSALSATKTLHLRSFAECILSEVEGLRVIELVVQRLKDDGCCSLPLSLTLSRQGRENKKNMRSLPSPLVGEGRGGRRQGIDPSESTR
jgi:hypothetical protein